jgi:hypothetical protein
MDGDYMNLPLTLEIPMLRTCDVEDVKPLSYMTARLIGRLDRKMCSCEIGLVG